MKVFPHARQDGTTAHHFHCPGCDGPHVCDARWSFSGTEEKPSLQPSILITCDYGEDGKPRDVCHSFVTNGRIEFLPDSTHKLAGQTVDLPDWNELHPHWCYG